ncbi:MAG TPA: hypothetical protein VN238_06810, partial [Solirubrobacteraceae bacterium]|nr:hypothetical protein [Solirubrobacteraceae bacterium]
VAAIELVGAGGRTVRLATVPAPAALAGTVAGELRFFLGRTPPQVQTTRLFGADGRLLHERDDVSDFEGRSVRPPVRVASGGRGAARWGLSVQVRNVLAPIAGEPGRRVRALCPAITREGRGTGTSCVALPLRAAEISVSDGCRTGGPNLVTGLGPANALPRRLVTTDGTVVPFRAIRLPAAFGAPDARAVVAVAPRGAGIRSVDGDAWQTAPTVLNPCDGASGGGFFSTRSDDRRELGGDAVVRPAGPGGPRVFVRDRDTELCVAVERTVRASDCGERAPQLGSFGAVPVAGGRMVGGVVDARVTRVRLTLSTGAKVEVPAAPDPAYTGRFAPYVAFFAATAPAGANFVEIAPIGPRGSVLEETPLVIPALTAPARRLGTVHLRGARRTVAQGPLGGDYGDCTFFTTARNLPGAGDACPFRQFVGSLVIDVPCGKTVVVGGELESRGARKLQVVLAGGRRITAPAVRLRDGTVAYVTVPRGAVLRRVEIVGRGGQVLHRYTTPVPRSSEHCGYGLGLRSYRDELRRRGDA